MNPSIQETYSPGVRSFIPLLYIAWADGLLSPSEVNIIRSQIDKMEHLTNEEKNTLYQWSDPSEWPSEEVFKEWLSMLKKAGRLLDYQDLNSIVELGIRMSEGARSGLSQMESEITRTALSELSEALDLDGMAKFRAFGVHQPDTETQIGSSSLDELKQLLEGEKSDINKSLRKLLSDPIFQVEPLRDKEQYRAKILNWLQHLAARGYGALGYPKAYGGRDSLMQYAAVFETLSAHDLSLAVKFGVQFGLFGGSIQSLGTTKHHDQLLADIGTAKLLGCFAMTETGHGSNVRDLETTAIYDPNTDEIIVNSPNLQSGKEYIGNALHGSMATVFAQLIVGADNHGVHAIMVPLRSMGGALRPGIKIEDCGYKLGLNGVDNGRIWFSEVRVPRFNLLDRFGKITKEGRYESEIKNPSRRFFTMLGTLVAGRICVGLGALSAAKASLTIAIKYALQRRQFGPENDNMETLIMDYPSHQRRLMPPLATAYALSFAGQYLVDRYERRNDEDIREIETLAAGIKAYATRFANETIQECREACGGKGYLWENRIADYRSDADIFATFEGDNTVLLQLVAKGLLSNFKEEFSGGGFMSAIRYLADQMGHSMTQINPIYKRKTDADHLMDPRFHTHAFEFRQRKMLFSLGNRMRNMFRKRITPYDAFLRVQNHMIALAEAYVEQVILTQFQQVVEDYPDGTVRLLLNELYQLFALFTIEKHKGWYLEHDYIEGVKTKAIRRRVDRLCGNIRANAGDLVDAFGIPNASLSAPIIRGSDSG